MTDSDDDVPALSRETLAALQSFYKEKEAQEQQLTEAVQRGEVDKVSLDEDWQLSQFWYNEETAERLAKEALQIAGTNGRIACVSAPTAYKKIRHLKSETCDVKCLEYDTRFSIYGEDFHFYDYEEPLNLPLDWKHSFDIVILDPPFLSEECLCKSAVTAKFLAKDKVILCTGAIMAGLAQKLLNASPCSFQPRHTNQLQNEFRCYTNYNSDILNKP